MSRISTGSSDKAGGNLLHSLCLAGKCNRQILIHVFDLDVMRHKSDLL